MALYYHSVPAGHRIRFARQMDILVRKSILARADAEFAPVAGIRYSIVTFDDGYQDLLTNALPELEKRNIPCTIFLVSHTLGEFPPWTDKKDDGERIMTCTQVKTLPSTLVTVGAHTATHPRLTDLDPDQACKEIESSRLALEALINREVKLFSFPYGAFNQNLIEVCRQVGFSRVFTTLPHPALRTPKEFVSGRVGVEASDWPIEFWLKVHGAYCWLPAAYFLKRKIMEGLGRSSGQSAKSLQTQVID